MTQKIIQELEERIVLLRAEMINLTGRDRHTHQRMIYELADKLARLQREREDELSSTSWDNHGAVEEVIEMKLTKLKRKELKRGDMFCDANGMLDRPVMMLFIDKHTHHYDPNAEVYHIDTSEQKEIDGLINDKQILQDTIQQMIAAERETQHEMIKAIASKSAKIDMLNVELKEARIDDPNMNAIAQQLELLDALLAEIDPYASHGYIYKDDTELADVMREICAIRVDWAHTYNNVG